MNNNILYLMDGDMFYFLHKCSKKRNAWFLLLLTALVLEIAGLFLQHVLLQPPCVYCIYIRVAIWGLFISGLIGLLAPNSILCYLAIIIWLYSSFKGASLSLDLVNIQFKPSLTTSCSFLVDFPSWLSLDRWLPFMFKPYGECSNSVFSFLGLAFSQWMVIIFAVYFLIAILVVIAQFFKPKRQWWR